MKPFNLASLVLIFLVSGYNVCCDSSSNIGQANFHNIQKRQASINNNISRQCYHITIREQCTSGYIQARLDLLFQCNQSSRRDTQDYLMNLQAWCDQNSMGDYCFAMLPYIFLDIQPISFVCSNSTSSCSTECKRQLINFRNEVGCCFNRYLPICGLERVTNCTSVIESPPVSVDPSDTEINSSIPVDQSCGGTSRLNCERRYIQPIVDALSLEGTCQISTRNILRECEVNEFGHYCSDIDSELGRNYSAARDNCRNTSVCEPLCRSGLENLGCCINYYYNRSSRPDPLLSYEFWLLCGLDTPGICESRLIGPITPTPLNSSPSGVTINIGVSVSIVTVLIILGISAGTIIYCIIMKRKKSKAK